MHPLSFFFDRIGQTIYRGNTPVQVTPENYTKLYDLQSESYTFREGYRIHKVELASCVSCEG